MPIYASPSDLPGADQPDNIDEQLAYASALVDGHLLTAVYQVDPEGMPQSPQLQEALKKAVVAQVRAWQALGIDPALGAAGASSEAPVASKSIGSGSIAYQTSSRAEEDKVQAAVGLSAMVQATLDAAIRQRQIGSWR